MAEEKVLEELGTVESSEAAYAVHWKEEDYYHPSPEFIGQANMTDPGIFERFSLENFPDCFREYAELLDWDQYWHTTLDTSDAPCWKWFVGGRLNACYNCVDRHLARYKNKTAIHFVPEPEDEPIQHITYQELYRRVNEVAAVLRDFCGLKTGDRVTLYLPMTPELPITMLACARLGVIHSVVFAGFSGQACGDRIWDSESRVLITIDGYYRNGKLLDHKANADVAVETASNQNVNVEKVLVWKRYKDRYVSQAPMVEGRDYFMNDVLKNYARATVEPVSMPAEGILFLMYTSGSTGKPKGAQHSIGGYLSYVAAMSKYVQDIHPEDVYWCMADIGWITGHSFIVYGPLAVAASSVIYEGVPTYPDAGRLWRIAEELDVNIFHTAPTTIRMLRKAGPDEPLKYNYKFKHMTTVGEPIEPEVWKWYYHVVGKGKAVIVDTWWQTETGGFLCSTVPALKPMKPGSAGPGVPGIHPVIYDDEGNEIPPGAGKAGNICIRNPWPGLMQTIWKDRDRFVSTYFGKYNKDPNSKDWRDWPYMAGDAAVMAADGYVRILGRVDDVINVAGHRLGTKEIESAALTVEEIAEAAVIAAVDELRGRIPHLYVSLKPGYEPSKEIEDKVSNAVATILGKIARPGRVFIVPDMPKTRSGKIMRRILAAISNRGDVGDVTTLANPDVVEAIRTQVQG
ncbi:acetate--CoA ligase [Desulfofundulus thermobenzoicus]|uniref:Acetate--CoA ligase n=1 Tax=Desulfofundulus thermobenzoicus TaxID=29376 RepID=A0A6N7IU74_9FIRM|nr:acetate--CoA ligase [Desulfofundulus thermobenzoicus]MQL53676.1 acetate--CoA ligase [Desulfofundulus thermobenzoicus]HHW43065.1 acetate--CoA ligase [Desulfotomaculum sp.]